MRAAFLITLTVILGIASGAAQQVRDATANPTVGTASIVGTVVVDEPDGQPLRLVSINLSLRSAAGFLERQTSTDERGRFELTNLPAGTYSPPMASKAGYAWTTHGAKRPGGVGTPITLVDGQRMTIAFKLLRGAVITGMIQDNGRPVEQTSVRATVVRIVNGVRTSGGSSGGFATTDDRGMYRIWGLPPGDYVVGASPRFSTQGEIRPITDAEMQWADRQLQPGSGQTAGTTPGGLAVPPPGQPVAPSPVYYPGTTDFTTAATVTVTAGQERSGVDFGVSYVPTAKVSGTVVDPEGKPATQAQLTLVPMLDPNVAMVDSMFMLDSMMMSNRATVIAGKFSVAGVRPGRYTIGARGASSSVTAGATPGPGRGSQPPMTLWATAEVTVDGRDQTDVELRLQPGMTLSGTTAFDSGTAQAPADLSRATVRLTAAPTAGVSVSVNVPSGPMEADGSFKLEGVAPGRYLLSATVPGATPGGGPWLLKSARVGDVDAADSAFEVRPNQSIQGIVLTFTDKSAELTGSLLDAAGQPTTALSIILFSTDRTMWSNRSRRMRQPVRPGSDGKFRFTSLLPGEYYLGALSDFEQSELFKPEFLEQVAAGAMKVTIREGEKKVQDVRIAGGG
jgi:hypothetical protein